MFSAANAALRRATLRLNQRFAGPVVSESAAAAPGARRTLADGAKEVEEKYAQSLSVLHWAIAGGFVFCAATVRASRRAAPRNVPASRQLASCACARFDLSETSPDEH
jgi:hypothetical protein